MSAASDDAAATPPPRGATRPGRLVVVSGPSGVGKGAVIARLLQRLPDTRRSVSVTTRPPRPNEREGVQYHFVDDARFHELVEAGDLLEWAHVHRWNYGTPRAWVERELAAGRTVLLEIDVQGALKVRSVVPDALLVFLVAPSWEELERRLAQRGTEPPEERVLRLRTAEAELAWSEAFDHVLVNDDLDACVEALAGLMTGPGEGDEALP